MIKQGFCLFRQCYCDGNSSNLARKLFILQYSSSVCSYLMLDLNEDAARESAVDVVAAAAKSFSLVIIPTAGLLPVH